MLTSYLSDKIPENRLREMRIQRGLTQEELADKAGVSRQTISGIESGQYGPSLSVALRIARALNSTLDSLFWLQQEEQIQELDAILPGVGHLSKGAKALVAKFSSGLVAYPVCRHDFLQEANSVITEVYNHNRVRVKIFNLDMLKRKTIFLAGCSPALAVLMQKVNNHYKDISVFWVASNSMQALKALNNGFVQGAGLHLFDEQTAEYNLPFIKKILKDKRYIVFNLCLGEQGLLVAKGNPKSIGGVGDLTRKNVRLVNREQGAEARRILDSSIRENGFKPEQIHGYNFKVGTHLEVAQAIAFGAADCGVALKSIAGHYDLDFIPFTYERYDLVFLKNYLEDPGVQALLEALNKMQVKAELQTYGYDTDITGNKLFDSCQ